MTKATIYGTLRSEPQARAVNCHPHEVTQDGQDSGCTWSVEEEFEPGHLTIHSVME